MGIVLLLIRVVLGALFVVHGTQKLWGWFRGEGPDRAGEYFTRVGFPRGRALARLVGAVEGVAGVALIAGLLTPLPSAVIVAFMINAILAAHRARSPLWVRRGGVGYPAALSVAALLLAFFGPGAYALDALVGLTLWGVTAGAMVALAGLASSFVSLAARTPEQPVTQR